MSDGIQFILFAFGVGLNVIGWTTSIQSKYTIPPIPVGWVFGVGFTIIGSSILIAAIVSIVRSRKFALYWGVGSILAGSMIFMGVRSFNKHPLEFPECPCPVNTWGDSCSPCPGNQNLTIICSGHGTCDEGSSGTGACICDYEWAGSDICSTCRAHYEGPTCETCSRGWDGLKCDKCYPGYTGKSCNVCAEGFLPEDDSLGGTLCRKCKPGRYGPFCEPCPQCNLHDDLAECKDNDWHNANLYQPNVCTATATTCTDDYDCSSFNCKGRCISGSTTDNTICSSDDDCAFGTCQFKTCCIEDKFGSGECLCKSVGFFGPLCEPCPGFSVYSSSICSGHGTCTASYINNVYSKLVCECSSEGDGFWDGEQCGCFKTSIDGECQKCANGFYSSTCQMCPGGSGVSQCSLHGECDDGVTGDGTCECDVDTKKNGLGAWKGESCSACLTSDLYGDQCQTCPLFTLLPCDGVLPVFGNTGYCSSSCGINTCNEAGQCV